MTRNQKPLRPCSKIGCSNLSTSRYCEQHKSQPSNDNRYYDRHIRNKKTDSFYHSAAWKRARDIVKVRDNGLCVSCLEAKRITVGTIVDHIVPVKQDWSKRLELDNLQLLCQSCHNKKTGKEKVNT